MTTDEEGEKRENTADIDMDELLADCKPSEYSYSYLKNQIKERGIVYENFTKFYSRIYKSRRLPRKTIVPQKQYAKIVNYLKTNFVLTQDNKVNQQGIRLFNDILKLEEKLEKMKDLDLDRGHSGGVVPCIREESSGGLVPCR